MTTAPSSPSSEPAPTPPSPEGHRPRGKSALIGAGLITLGYGVASFGSDGGQSTESETATSPSAITSSTESPVDSILDTPATETTMVVDTTVAPVVATGSEVTATTDAAADTTSAPDTTAAPESTTTTTQTPETSEPADPYLEALQSAERNEFWAGVFADSGVKLIEELEGNDFYHKKRKFSKDAKDNSINLDLTGNNVGQNSRINLLVHGTTGLPVEVEDTEEMSEAEMNEVVSAGLEIVSLEAFHLNTDDNALHDSFPNRNPYRTFVEVTKTGDAIGGSAFVLHIERLNDEGNVEVTTVSGQGVEFSVVTKVGEVIVAPTLSKDKKAVDDADQSALDAIKKIAQVASVHQ